MWNTFAPEADEVLEAKLNEWAEANGVTLEISRDSDSNQADKVMPALEAGTLPDGLFTGADVALQMTAAGGTASLREQFTEIGEAHDPETHLIPNIIRAALDPTAKPVTIFGDDYDTPDGTCVRDYIHVEDLASAHILALEALREKEVLHFNLGNGNGFSVKEVVETVREVSGHAIPAEIAPRRAGDPATLIADSRRIREELGWVPRYPDLHSIVRTAWDWHGKHPRGYGERA